MFVILIFDLTLRVNVCNNSKLFYWIVLRRSTTVVHVFHFYSENKESERKTVNAQADKTIKWMPSEWISFAWSFASNSKTQAINVNAFYFVIDRECITMLCGHKETQENHSTKSLFFLSKNEKWTLPSIDFRVFYFFFSNSNSLQRVFCIWFRISVDINTMELWWIA